MPRLKHKDSGATVSVGDDHPYASSGAWESVGKSSEPQQPDAVEDDKTLPAREDQQPPEAKLVADDPVDVSIDEQPNGAAPTDDPVDVSIDEQPNTEAHKPSARASAAKKSTSKSSK